MSAVVDSVLFCLACLAALPCCVFFWECLLGALYRPKARAKTGQPRPSIAVLVPAHDESAGITTTLTGLFAQLAAPDVLLVVADNCSDDTATVAAASGARVIERQDSARRGKGYALAFGIEHLAASPPDVVVIVDADCSVSEGGIERIARMARDTDSPVQADYWLTPSEQPSGRSVISALAFVVKNRVRPRGLAALGLPCLLTGTGMAFPWAVLRKAPPTHDHLVEDMVMGLELARLGHAPRLCPDAHVQSALPERARAASAQRRRWEHGHLATLLDQAPRLLWQGVRQARIDLIGLALDLLVPPLSLLVLMLLAGLALCALAALLGASSLPLGMFAFDTVAIALGVGVGWFAYGRELVRARDLLAIPLYVVWKLPLYFSFFARGRHRGWERTERDTEASKEPKA
jgi:cellulose synthase/poly-beta-1,6-N-acetylglucosamine synthase-like glycosyltransferase